jgi:peptide/nickel transport system substrate-binding protein
MTASWALKDFHAGQVCLAPLACFDVDTDPMLVLAAEWPSIENETLDPNGNFVIRKHNEGVTWHDGEDFAAEDVAFTDAYVSDPGTTATTLGSYETVESVEVFDDYTEQVNFAEPDPAWFDLFVGDAGVILPQPILADAVGEAARDREFNLMPVGTGAWRVREFRPGDIVLHDINMDYHIDGLPFFDEVELKGGGDSASAAQAVMETGEADWAWNLQVEPQILQQMEPGGAGQFVPIPGTSAERIMVNFADPNSEVDGAFSEPTNQHPIWQHHEARQALKIAIQRDVVVEQLYTEADVATGDVLNVPTAVQARLAVGVRPRRGSGAAVVDRLSGRVRRHVPALLHLN